MLLGDAMGDMRGTVLNVQKTLEQRKDEDAGKNKTLVNPTKFLSNQSKTRSSSLAEYPLSYLDLDARDKRTLYRYSKKGLKRSLRTPHISRSMSKSCTELFELNYY
jgi:hypothetical protein